MAIDDKAIAQGNPQIPEIGERPYLGTPSGNPGSSTSPFALSGQRMERMTGPSLDEWLHSSSPITSTEEAQDQIGLKERLDNKRYSFYRPGADNEDIYAASQGFWDTIGNAGMNLLQKTFAYTAQNAGFVLGAPGALATWDVSKMTDNFLVNAGNAIKEQVQENYPIYKSKKYSEGNIWQKLGTAGWWMDDAMDRVALTAAMFVPGAAEAKGFGLASVLENGLKAVADNPESYGFIGKTFLPKLYKAAVEGVADVGSNPALKAYAQSLKRGELYAWNIIGQSGLNAMETQNGIKAGVRQDRADGKEYAKDLTDDDINQMAAQGAVKSFWETVPLTLAGSYLEVKTMFKSFKALDFAERKLSGLFNKETGAVLEGALAKPKINFGATMLEAGLTGLEHGQNESMQVAISRYNEESARGKDPRGTIPGIWGDFLDNVNDPNGQNNIALGTIQGILMTLGGTYGGAAMNRLTKDGKEATAREQAYKENVIKIINQNKLNRRIYNGDFVQRDENGKMQIVDGKPVLDQQKIADAGLSVLGVQLGMQEKQEAAAAGNHLALEVLNQKSLASMAQPYFEFKDGVEHLTNILKLEAEEAKKDPDRVDNVDKNGVKITPDVQLQKNLAFIQKLNSLYQAVDQRHAGFMDMDVDSSDKETLKKAQSFLEDHKLSQYFEGAVQDIISGHLQDTVSELASLRTKLGQEFSTREEAVEEPSSPDEERFNELLERQTTLEDSASDSRIRYKALVDKAAIRKAFKDELTQDQKAKDIVEENKKAATTPTKTSVKIKTKDGEKEYETGTQYFVGRVVEHTADGKEVYRYPTLTILGENPDGTLKIRDGKGEERDISKDKLEDYKLHKVSDIKGNKTANFYYNHVNDVFEYNFGEESEGKRRGRLELENDQLLFVYKDSQGKIQKKPIDNSYFVPIEGDKSARLKKVSTLVPETAAQKEAREAFTSKEEVAKQKKTLAKNRDIRLGIITDLEKTTREALENINKKLLSKTDSLEAIKKELEELKEVTVDKSRTKKQEGTPKVTRQKSRFTKLFASTSRNITRLSRLKESVETEIASLTAQKEDLEMNLSYFQDITKNLDKLPENSGEFLKELHDQTQWVEELIKETATNLSSLGRLATNIEKTIQDFVSFLKDITNKFDEKYPDYLRNSFERMLSGGNLLAEINVVKEYQADLAFLDDTKKEITINQEKLDKINGRMEDLYEELVNLGKEYTAKKTLLDKVEGSIKEYEEKKRQEDEVLKNEELKKELFKDQADVEKSSGTTITGSDDVDTELIRAAGEKEDKKKAIHDLFRSSTSPSKNLKPHQEREQVFLNNVKTLPNGTKLKAVLFTANQQAAMGISGAIELLDNNRSEANELVDPNDGFVAIVYVEDAADGYYFVNKEGKRVGKVGETVDPNNIILSTMPDTSLNWDNGIPRYRAGEEAEAKIQQAGWLKDRQRLFDHPADRWADNMYNFTISRGIPVYSEGNEHQSVVGTLVPKDKIAAQGLIEIPTNGTVSHNGVNIGFPNGRPVLHFEDTVQPLNNRNFNKKEAENIAKLLHKLAEDYMANKQLNKQIVRYLQNVLYWGKQVPKSEGEAAKPTGRNQIYIDLDNMTLVIGSGEKAIPFTPADMAANQETLIAAMQLIYNNINNDTLANHFSEPFEEITGVNEDGSLKTRQWKSYQNFLLSDTYDLTDVDTNEEKGKTRPLGDIPLHTTVRPISKSVSNDVNFEQKYSTLEGYDLPVEKPVVTKKEETPKQAVQKEENKGFILDGETENVYIGSKGEKIKFSGKEPDNLKIKEDEDATKIMVRLSGNKELIDSMRKQGAEGTNEEIANQILRQSMYNAIMKERGEAAPAEKPVAVVKEEVKEEGEQKVGPAKNTLTGTKAPSREFSAADDDNAARMTEEDIQAFKEWHAENTPGIPYEILDNLIQMNPTQKAWGVFESGVAKIFKEAKRGTEYHEIFEGVWKAFVPQDQKTAILKEMEERTGSFKDRQTGDIVPYFNATEKQLKEKLADEFAEYRLGKMSPKSLGQKVVDFFKNLMRFFKYFLTGKKDLANDLFESINTGAFKDQTVSKDIILDQNPEYSIANLSAEQTHLAVQDIAMRVRSYFVADNSSLFNIHRNEIKFQDLFAAIKNEWAEEGKLDRVGELGWQDLVDRTRDFLRTVNIVFDEDSILTINDEGKTQVDYSPDAFTVDAKKSSPYPIKLLLAFLPKTDPSAPKNRLKLTPLKLNKQSMGFELVNFSQAFSTVLNKLSGMTSIEEMAKRLHELSREDSDYERLVSWMNINPSTGEIMYSKLNKDDWRLLTMFYNVFSKQNPTPYNQYINGEEVYIGSSALSSVAKETERQWVENMKVLAAQSNSMIKFNPANRTYEADPVKIGRQLTKFPEQRIKFLNALGIDISKEDYQRLNRVDRKAFDEAVASIQEYLKKTTGVVTMSGKTLGIGGPLNTLSELYTKSTNPPQESTFFNGVGNKRQTFENHNYVSLFSDRFNQFPTLKDLLTNSPQFRDPFSQRSLVLKPGGIFFAENGERIGDLKISYSDSNVDVEDGKGTETKNLSLPNRFVQEFNNNLNGNYNILIAADSSTTWMISMGHPMSYSEFNNPGNVWKTIYGTFNNYLRDEIALAQDYKRRNELYAVAGKGKELRFFKEILSPKLNTLVQPVVEGKQDMEEFISEHQQEINDDIKAYIEGSVYSTRRFLLENKKVDEGDNHYAFPEMDSEFAIRKDVGINKNDMTEAEFNKLLTFSEVNYILSNIEQHKVIYGDPYQYEIKKKGKNLDETKRIKMSLSPRRRTLNSSAFNNFLNENYNDAYGIKLEAGVPGYNLNREYVQSATVVLHGNSEDVIGSSAFSGEIGKKAAEVYEETKEGDSFSIALGSKYREIKLRNGQWDNEAAEAFYQWDTAYTRMDLAKKGIFKNYSDALRKRDEETLSKAKPEFVGEILKPIVFGPKYGANELLINAHKLSQMPIFYSTLKEGTNIQKLWVKMWKEDTDYIIFKSGEKVGTEQVHNLYTEDGSFNESAFRPYNKTSWNYYSIQVENSYEGGKMQTMGSQKRKLITVDLLQAGVPVDVSMDLTQWNTLSEDQKLEASPIYSLVKEQQKNDEELIQVGYDEFLRRLGIVDTGDGYQIHDVERAARTIKEEIAKRGLSDNAMASISINPETGWFTSPMEASPKYKDIRNLLTSIVDKSILKPKVSGGMKVQAPALLWESAAEGRDLVIKKGDKWQKISREEYAKLSDKEKGAVRLTSNSLKWYTKDEPWIEVMLPHWFGQKFYDAGFKNEEELLKYLNNTEEGRRILQGTGFRIPTAHLAQMENFKVKSFLPKEFGDSIIVPSEIVVKAGSDFDIDKLSTYLKNTYVDSEGRLRYADYHGTQEETRKYYQTEYSKILSAKETRLWNSMEKKERLLGALETLSEGAPKKVIQKITDLYGKQIDLYTSQFESLEDAVDQLVIDLNRTGKEYDKVTNEELQATLKEGWVNQMVKQSVENKYFESSQKLLSLQHNFERMLTPTDAGGLDKLAEKINDLSGKATESIKGRLINRVYMASTRNAFLTSKKWVATTAINITGHSLTQRVPTFIDLDKLKSLPEVDKKWLGNGLIALKHNTLTINGKEYASLSGIKDAAGREFISDVLQNYSTAVVDAAKDPFIIDIIPTDMEIPVHMLAVRLGINKEDFAMFMHQPAIRAFIRQITLKGSRFLFDEKVLSSIENMFNAPVSALKGASIDVKNFASNIRNYAEGAPMTDQEKAEQILILREFLKYAKMADHLFKLTQATNYDTSSFRSSDAYFRKSQKTQRAETQNIISSAKGLLEGTFIEKQRQRLEDSIKALSTLFVFDRPEVRKTLEDILKPYANDMYLSDENFQKVADSLRFALIDYLVQTKKDFNTAIKGVLLDMKSSTVGRLLDAQRKYPDNPVVKMFKTINAEENNKPKNLKAYPNPKDAYDENLYTGYLRELKEDPEMKVLYKHIVGTALLQGVGNSPYSFVNLIPVEDYAKFITPILQNIGNLADFNDLNQFQRNNWREGNIVPKIKITNKNSVFIYGSVPKAIFTMQPTPGQLIAVSPKYNGKHIQYEVIKTQFKDPKIAAGKRMDMMKAGDYSFMVTRLYQKVRDPQTGEPLLNRKGDYIYKQINAWGDGFRAQEYYNAPRPSVIDNGTAKLEQELNDNDILRNYHGIPEAEAQAQKALDEAIIFGDKKVKLKDGKFYTIDKINAEMLFNMGYEPAEIGKIFKDLC